MIRRHRRFIRLRVWLRRRVFQLLSMDYPHATNQPDLPWVASGWTVLDTGRWGTLASTHVGSDRVLLAVFQGYAQTDGVMLTRDNLNAILDTYDVPARVPGE